MDEKKTPPGGRPVRPWDLPVGIALDEVELLPGFAPDRVEWAGFRFWGEGLDKPPQRATIYAYPAGGDDARFVRFGTDTGTALTGRGRHPLTSNDAASILELPEPSVARAAALLIPALRTSLRIYNAISHPQQAQRHGLAVAFAASPSRRAPARNPASRGLGR